MSIEPELHATSDALLDSLDRLRALEQEKRDLPIGSPRLIELAEQIERLAATVLGTSATQVDLAKEAVAETKTRGLDPNTTIEEMASRPRDVHTVLSEWREAERRLGLADGGSTEATRLRADIELLREEYRRAHDAAARRVASSE